MRIAWFRSTTLDALNPLDDTAALIDELRATHAIDVVVEADAHDFVWRHYRTPWDLCVYELENTRAHQFEWAYLLNYPGVVLLKSPAVENSCGGALSREGRLDDYMTAFRLDDREQAPLRVPLLASRSAVVPYAGLAESLQETYPSAHVRVAPIGVRRVGQPHSIERAPNDQQARRATLIGVLDQDRLDVVERAFQRAREAGADIELLAGDSPANILARSDVIVAVTWPPFETPLTAAVAAMAAGKPLVTMELDATAEWPALDPQTWRPRGVVPTGAPVAVTIDPRDEVHSLMLAIRRLASDAPLREQLGNAAYAWWQAYATPAHAAAAWAQILREAATLAPPPKPADWPKHLGADGTELADAILDEFKVASDI